MSLAMTELTRVAVAEMVTKNESDAGKISSRVTVQLMC